MRRKEYVFLKNYKTVRVEGFDAEALLNWCMREGIRIQSATRISDTEIQLTIDRENLGRLKKRAGGRFNITVTGSSGMGYRVASLMKSRSLLAGIIVFCGIIFYQSLFVSEISIKGYECITEDQLRESLAEAGLYEGCRKKVDDIEKIKLKLYDEYDQLTWIGIKFRGTLAQVEVDETGFNIDEKEVPDDTPCNIVADRPGYIAEIKPLEGIRAAEDGQYVREGDVLISGRIPVEHTDGKKGRDALVHAEGTVKAKIPVRVVFYGEAFETVTEKTGRRFRWVSVNGMDLSRGWLPYEASVVTRKTVIDWCTPVRLKIQLVLREEVEIKHIKIHESQAKSCAVNEIGKYIKENFGDKAQILNKSLNFVMEKNIINIGVTLETLQEIGIEEEIVVDKSKRKSEKNDNQ